MMENEMMKLTARQGAIVTAYTGVMAGSFADFHAYAEEKLGRPIWTHEFPSVADELKEAAKADFVAICAMRSRGEEFSAARQGGEA